MYLLAIYFVAYILVLLGIVLRVGSCLDVRVSRAMIFVGTVTAVGIAYHCMF